MLITNDWVTPVVLTGYVRAALADWTRNRFTLSTYLPDQTISDLDYRFYRGGQGLIEAATFRAYDAESPIGARPGVMQVQGELPPMSRKIRLGEYDRLRMRNATGGILAAIQTDAELMTKALAGRMELARGEALWSSKLTLAENGVQATVDFGRDPSHTVTASVAWSDTANAQPVVDMMGWQDTYLATNGERPGRILMSQNVFNLLLRNVQFRELAGTTLGVPTLVSSAAVTSTMASYGLPPIVINDEQIRTAGGVATRAIPANKIVFLPSDVSELGSTLWGITAESMEPDFGIEEADQPGIVAGSYATKDPVAVWTKAAAIGLPIVVNPDLTLTATVTA